MSTPINPARGKTTPASSGGSYRAGEKTDPDAALPNQDAGAPEASADTMGEDEFVGTYSPQTKPNGDYFDFDDVKHLDPKNVWTIVEGDDICCDDGECEQDDLGEECEGHAVLFAEAGFHVVSQLGYVTSEKPWVTGAENAFW